MTTLRTAVQQALEALEKIADWHGAYGPFPENNEAWRGMAVVTARESVNALRAALEQQEQKPVAWIQPDHLQKARVAPFLCRVEPTRRCSDFVPIYTHPPRREWQGLTEAEAAACWSVSTVRTWQAIEAALKEKNHE